MPTINPMFAILLPTRLPTINPLEPFSDAAIEDASSGKDVPTAIKVKPIIKSETPSALAILEPDSTNLSEPPTKRTSPIIISNNSSIIKLRRYSEYLKLITTGSSKNKIKQDI